MNSPFSIASLSRHAGRHRQQTIICFSHLRWGFVHQRPQHLLNQAADSYRVYFIEEPEFASGPSHYRMQVAPSGVVVLTPVCDASADAVEEQRLLAQGLHRSLAHSLIVHWFYTPMALRFARDLPSDLCIYDCMDELSAFRFAPADLAALEQDLLRRADLVFTGGRSLYAAKRPQHPNVHCFPSSIDTAHFGRARTALPDPADQAGLPSPRIGFAGVIDERIDLTLIATAASALPQVQFVMLGPIAKIDAADLPQADNIHWLGRKEYDDLPAYLANWQAAWMPFALNEATRFISPTKTPEYLAAGLPVTATAVQDVVSGYGQSGLVTIADQDTIVIALQDSLDPPASGWLQTVDRLLALSSWAGTWQEMDALMLSHLSVGREAVDV
jgi:glycosyltransferase involved in cell wall biosynthesis